MLERNYYKILESMAFGSKKDKALSLDSFNSHDVFMFSVIYEMDMS